MPLMSCPKCGKNVSSLASVCPQCSYPLREQRLKESQMGPQISCRKCDHLISANSRVCPHCGVDFPKRTFNLFIASVPLAAIILVFAIMKLLPSGDNAAEFGTEPTPAADASSDSTPALPESNAVVSAQPSEADSILEAPPIVAAPPPTPTIVDTTVRATTRWAADWANVRASPTRNAPSVHVLNPGQRIEVGTYTRGWWEVFVDGQLLGYVANSLLLREPPAQ